MFKRNCDNCALPSVSGGICPFFRADMSGKDGCPRHASVEDFCEACGNLIVGPAFIIPKTVKLRKCAATAQPFGIADAVRSMNAALKLITLAPSRPW